MNKVIVTIAGLAAAAVTTAGFYLGDQAYAPMMAAHIREALLGPRHVTVFVAGDMMLDRGIRYYATKNGGYGFIFEKLAGFLEGNDINLVNLEGPVTSNPSRSAGSKPGSFNNYFFTFDPVTADVLFNHNIRLVSLGNNHILNFGEQGVEQTQEYLSRAGVSYFGAPGGSASIVMDVKGIKVGFVNYNQFYGTEQYAAKTALDAVRQVRAEADIVVVYCHWGEEYFAGRTPAQQSLARQLIEEGADVVVGAHPHVVAPMEEYQGKRIYYSLGNFVFDQYFQEDVRKGMGVLITIDRKTKSLSFEEKHFYLDHNGQTIGK